MAVSIYQVPRFNNTRQERSKRPGGRTGETPGRRMDLVCFSTENRGLVEKYGPEHGFSTEWGHFVEKLRLRLGFSMKMADSVETMRGIRHFSMKTASLVETPGRTMGLSTKLAAPVETLGSRAERLFTKDVTPGRSGRRTRTHDSSRTFSQH